MKPTAIGNAASQGVFMSDPAGNISPVTTVTQVLLEYISIVGKLSFVTPDQQLYL
jgi:hypothetical protein